MRWQDAFLCGWFTSWLVDGLGRSSAAKASGGKVDRDSRSPCFAQVGRAAVRASSRRDHPGPAPGTALRPSWNPGLVRHRRWQHTTRGPIGVGVAMLAQRPARLAVGSAGVALAVVSDTLVLGVAWHFRDTLIGTFLGDAVAVQARTPDLVAAGVITLLALTAVATLLFLEIAQDIKRFGALRAVGWADAKVAVAICTQAAILAVVGIAVGVGVALGAWLLAFHSIDGLVLRAALTFALIGAIVTLCASLVPGLTLSATRIARVLSSE